MKRTSNASMGERKHEPADVQLDRAEQILPNKVPLTETAQEKIRRLRAAVASEGYQCPMKLSIAIDRLMTQVLEPNTRQPQTMRAV